MTHLLESAKHTMSPYPTVVIVTKALFGGESKKRKLLDHFSKITKVVA
jgi:hypothetical protein